MPAFLIRSKSIDILKDVSHKAQTRKYGTSVFKTPTCLSNKIIRSVGITNVRASSFSRLYYSYTCLYFSSVPASKASLTKFERKLPSSV